MFKKIFILLIILASNIFVTQEYEHCIAKRAEKIAQEKDDTKDKKEDKKEDKKDNQEDNKTEKEEKNKTDGGMINAIKSFFSKLFKSS